MSAIHYTWTVLPHGPLIPIDDGILTVTGEIHMPLVNLQRRMTIVRLNDGSSLIYSAIALSEPQMKQIEALGTPRYLVVPGGAHRLDARVFKQRYPELKVIAPLGAKEHIEHAVGVDNTKLPASDPEVKLDVVAGTGEHEFALLIRRASGLTLVLNDLIGNLRRKGGFEGWLLHVMGFGDDNPQIPTVTKMLVIENKAQLRQQLIDWSDDTSLKRIVVSHGEPIECEPRRILRELADTLA